MGCRGCAQQRRQVQQQKDYGMVAATNVTLPDDAIEHLKNAIKSFRLAAISLEQWQQTQSRPVQMVVGRLLLWWRRSVSLAEPFVVQSYAVEVTESGEGNGPLL